MGADLVGYLCFGPKKISKESLQLALVQARETQNRIRKWDKDTREYFEDYGIREPSDAAWLLAASKDELEAIVQGIVNFWESPDVRDVADRDVPGKRDLKAMFCGELTWGDEPDGEGYQTLKQMFILGIGEALGIK